MKSFFKDQYRKNKSSIITALVIVVVVGFWTFFQNKELNESGVTVEGKVIECQMIRMNGACEVKIEFYTSDCEKRVSENTLYEDGNCVVGKKVKLRYSTESKLTDVLEEEMK